MSEPLEPPPVEDPQPVAEGKRAVDPSTLASPELRREVANDQAASRARRSVAAADDVEQDVWLKRIFAWVVVGLLVTVIPTAEIVFVYYLHANDWRVPAGTIEAWFGATVIEVLGLAAIVVRSLFRNRG